MIHKGLKLRKIRDPENRRYSLEEKAFMKQLQEIYIEITALA